VTRVPSGVSETLSGATRFSRSGFAVVVSAVMSRGLAEANRSAVCARSAGAARSSRATKRSERRARRRGMSFISVPSPDDARSRLASGDAGGGECPSEKCVREDLKNVSNLTAVAYVSDHGKSTALIFR
jgi:hypothetical protein